MNTEAFYDDHIAPELLRLGKLCQEQKIPFLAVVSLPDGLARSEYTPEHSPMAFRMASMAARANGNADSLIMGLMEHARECGHESMCLKLLGVDERPAANTIGETA